MGYVYAKQAGVVISATKRNVRSKAVRYHALVMVNAATVKDLLKAGDVFANRPILALTVQYQ
ncbi:hypothetical protein ANCDUO_24989 [Ancylostoma duodenale]|uniref:Uncharacterized protein n=1 Tax=Ancylostoma duodenale TaxID=51022 RepID=A0A0C2C5L4_9BILA|nr:hypothetical protein ANCDUO_24989 [Ancylostoma duodenale]